MTLSIRSIQQQRKTEFNNVLPVNINGQNLIVKRLTRFNTQAKNDKNFIGSKCEPNPKEKNIFNLIAPIRNDECEYKEVFTNIVLSYYLNQMYGNICPKTYAVLVITSNDKVNHEVYIISESMRQTLDDWLEIGSKSQDEINTLVGQMLYISDCLHINHLPDILVDRFKYILFTTYETKNFRQYELTKKPNEKVYIKFGDCKGDNIMIDENSKWRVIDVDGFRLYKDELKMLNSSREVNENYMDSSLLSCGFDFRMVDFYPAYKTRYDKLVANGNLDKMVYAIQNLSSLPDIQTYLSDTRILELNLYIDALTERLKPVQYDNKYLKYKNKYLKYKNKYLQLKNKQNTTFI